tara:strand:- start:1130 stop:1438 length:309 start_codon:yes stop_codon:yes gene_type:complete
MTKKYIRLPSTFVTDHNERCSDKVIIWEQKHFSVYASENDIALFDLYSDALYYATNHGPTHWNDCPADIIASAKRTVKAIEKQMNDEWMHDYKNKNYMFKND